MENKEHGAFTKFIKMILTLAFFTGFTALLGNTMDAVSKDLDKRNRENRKKKYLAFMNGKLIRLRDESFNKLQVDNFMGGTEIDVTRADFEDGAVITINSIMGGVTVKVPPMVHVVIEDKSILSGCSNLVPVYDEKVKTLNIQTNLLMSGVSVKMIP